MENIRARNDQKTNLKIDDMGLKVDLKIQLLVIKMQVRNEARMQHLQAPGGHIFPEVMSWVPSRRFRSVRRSRHFRPGQFFWEG